MAASQPKQAAKRKMPSKASTGKISKPGLKLGGKQSSIGRKSSSKLTPKSDNPNDNDDKPAKKSKSKEFWDLQKRQKEKRKGEQKIPESDDEFLEVKPDEVIDDAESMMGESEADDENVIQNRVLGC